MKNIIIPILLILFIAINKINAQDIPSNIDRQKKRLKTEVRIFSKTHKNVLSSQRDTFIDDNKNGINALLGKEEELSPLFRFLKEEINNSFSKKSSDNEKQLATPNKPLIYRTGNKSLERLLEKIKAPEKPQKPKSPAVKKGQDKKEQDNIVQ